ncbi:MAG: glycosyltransferase, partial [Geminicoccales bacterium]
PGSLRLFLADDGSSDDTAARAQEAAAALGKEEALYLVTCRPPAEGWTGKLSALEQARACAAQVLPQARYYWLNDADIAPAAHLLRHLVAKAEVERLTLVSLMARLDAHGPWPALLIPPFVYFFMQLYPFAWVADPRRATAAAAGGVVLLRRAALERIGGFPALADALIDDVTLAARVKRSGGAIWLGLGEEAVSLRPYRDLAAIWDMVARSAYTQLRHAPALLAVALLGLAFAYLVPPLTFLFGLASGAALTALAGLAGWLLMAYSYWPTLHFFRRPWWQAFTLPLVALAYGAMTVDSAWRHRKGRGGAWKGPHQAARLAARRRRG